MTDNFKLETDSQLQETTLSNAEAKKKFGAEMVEEVHAEFTEDAKAAFESDMPEGLGTAEDLQDLFEGNPEDFPPEFHAEFMEDAKAAFEAEAPETLHPEEALQALAGENPEEFSPEFQAELMEDAKAAFEEAEAPEALNAEADLQTLIAENPAELPPDPPPEIKDVFESPSESFKEVVSETAEAERAPKDLAYLLSDDGLQSLISVFWEGFQHPEGEREPFLKEALSREEFQFFPLLSGSGDLSSSLAMQAVADHVEAEKAEMVEIAPAVAPTPTIAPKAQPSVSFEYARGLAWISLQIGEIKELRRNAMTLLSWCVGLFAASAMFAAIIFSVSHLPQGKAALLSLVLIAPVLVIILSIASLGRIWEYFTFIRGSGEPADVAIEGFEEGDDFLSQGLPGIERKFTQNKTMIQQISMSLEQSVQRLILAGCLIGFSSVIWMSLAISSTFERFLSWGHVAFFVLISLILSLVTFFVRIGQWKKPSTGKRAGWGCALFAFIFILFGAGAIARGPIRVDPNAMPEISASWVHSLSPNGFFEAMRGWFYPGIALQWVPPKP